MADRRISNTTAADPVLLLAESVAMGTSRAIEAQEARGQAELVGSEQIPTKGVDDTTLIAMGFTLGPPTPGDRLFRAAKLPPGWRKQPTDHPMWSRIADAKGRERISVFYKAAFYDRDAFMRTLCRWRWTVLYPDGAGDPNRTVVITDAGGTHRMIGEYVSPDWGGPRHVAEAQSKVGDKVQAEAKEWLAEQYPDHENPLAYWED